MLCLEAGQTLRGLAGTASVVQYNLEGFELAAGAESYKQLAAGLFGTSSATLYTAPASTQSFIKSMIIMNTSASIVSGIRLRIGGTSAVNNLLGSMTLAANGFAVFEESGWSFYNADGSRRLRAA